MLDIYACRSCDHTQFSKEKPLSCERCGGSVSKIHGVQVVESEGDVDELSRKSGHHRDPKPFQSAGGTRG